MIKLIITFGMFQARLDWEAHPASLIGIISRFIEKALISSTLRAPAGAGGARRDGASDGSEGQGDVAWDVLTRQLSGEIDSLSTCRHLWRNNYLQGELGWFGA